MDKVKEYVQYLQNLPQFSESLSLERISALLGELGEPQKQLKGIHVSGTNGKGSSCAMLYSILRTAGYKVGMYSSPHLVSYAERFRIGDSGDDRVITETEFADLIGEIRPAVEKVKNELGEAPTWFEVLTAIAFLYFASEQVDWAVLEVGLGGRLDATNVRDWEYKMITNVSLDHTKILGQTVQEIAYEKAGIIHTKYESRITNHELRITNNAPRIVTGCSGVALEVVRKTAVEAGQKLLVADEDFSAVLKNMDWEGLTFGFGMGDVQFYDLKSPLIGNHQMHNAASVVALILLMRDNGDIELEDQQIYTGLVVTFWSGRFELVAGSFISEFIDKPMQVLPRLVLDGAHNRDGMEKLVDTVLRFKADGLISGQVVAVFAAKRDKDAASMLTLLSSIVDQIVISPIHELIPSWEEEVPDGLGIPLIREESVEQALNYALRQAGRQDLVLVCGSLYLVGEVKRLLMVEDRMSFDSMQLNQDARVSH